MIHNIKVLLNGDWIPARNYQKDAFIEFQNMPSGDEFEYDNKLEGNFRIKFSIVREQNQRCYIVREDNTKIPIADWNNVQVFILDHPSGVVNWYDTRDYQTWAYFDFVYSDENEKHYKSKHSTNLLQNVNYTEIPIDNLFPGIIFRFSRCNTGSIFYEKNDWSRRRTKISDDNKFRNYYLGFYSRMTSDDIGFTNCFSPKNKITIPDVAIEKTNDESLVCIICNENKKNVILSCNHDLTCSECCAELLKFEGRLKCPFCRSIASSIKEKN